MSESKYRDPKFNKHNKEQHQERVETVGEFINSFQTALDLARKLKMEVEMGNYRGGLEPVADLEKLARGLFVSIERYRTNLRLNVESDSTDTEIRGL